LLSRFFTNKVHWGDKQGRPCDCPPIECRNYTHKECNDCYHAKRTSTVCVCGKKDARCSSSDAIPPTEFGVLIVLAGQGKRSDLADVRAAVKSGASIVQLFDEHDCMFRYASNILKYRACLQAGVTTASIEREVRILFGLPGSGKTRWANDYAEARGWSIFIASPNNSSKLSFEDYDNQQLILVDELDIGSLDIAQLKALTGDRAMKLPGRMVSPIGRHIAVIITCQQGPEHWMRRNLQTPVEEPHLTAMKRRCTSIWNCGATGWTPQICGNPLVTGKFVDLQQHREMTEFIPNPYGIILVTNPSSSAWPISFDQASSVPVVVTPSFVTALLVPRLAFIPDPSGAVDAPVSSTSSSSIMDFPPSISQSHVSSQSSDSSNICSQDLSGLSNEALYQLNCNPIQGAASAAFSSSSSSSPRTTSHETSGATATQNHRDYFSRLRLQPRPVPRSSSQAVTQGSQEDPIIFSESEDECEL